MPCRHVYTERLESLRDKFNSPLQKKFWHAKVLGHRDIDTCIWTNWAIFYSSVDTGHSMEDHEASGIRLPDSLARPQIICKLNETATGEGHWDQINPAVRLKSRPDIMLVDMLASQAATQPDNAMRSSRKRSRDGATQKEASRPRSWPDHSMLNKSTFRP